VACEIRRVIEKVFEPGFWSPAAIEDRWAGACHLRLFLSARAVVMGYGRSLQPARAELRPVEIAVMGRDEADLHALVPMPSSEGRAYISESCSAIWHSGDLPILYLFDRESRRGLIWFAAGEAPPWEVGRPACPLIQLALLETPWTTVHSAAVGVNGKFLMLTGVGNSGKSTAALACARAGWSYAGDDYVLAHTKTAEVAPLFTSARLRLAMASEFSDWLKRGEHSISAGSDPRYELTLQRILRHGQFTGGFVRALLIVRRTGEARPKFSSATRGDAFNSLFLNTNFGAPGPLGVTVKKLAALVGLMPVFHVDSGTAPEAIPEAFERFIESL
jgi:hypothetical protein